ncbi:MAG: DUF975 family protein [Sarcina sp.]
MESRKTLKLMAKDQLKNGKHGYWSFVISLIIFDLILAIVSALEGHFHLTIISGVLGIFLISPLSAGFYYAAYRTTEGKLHVCSFLNFISSGIKSYFKIIILQIIISIIIGIGFIILIIPGIILTLLLSQSIFIMCKTDCSIGYAISHSIKLMKGHLWEYFVFQWSFILWYLLIAITLGIASIFVLPYINTTFANYYNSLERNVMFNA